MREGEIIRLLLARNEAGMDALLERYGPLLRYVIAPILSAEQDAAGDLQSLYIIMQAVQAFEQGALSAAGGTYDTGNLVSGEGKRHIFQDMRSADVYVQVMDS